MRQKRASIMLSNPTSPVISKQWSVRVHMKLEPSQMGHQQHPDSLTNFDVAKSE